MTEEQFMRLCQENPELRIELTAKGELVIMPPTGSKTGLRKSTLTYELVTWISLPDVSCLVNNIDILSRAVGS